MPKPTISSYVKKHGTESGKKGSPGPFVTISRQFGCDGYAIGELVVSKLNEIEENKRWKLYEDQFITQLSEDTGLSEDHIRKERLSPPSLWKDFMRGIKRSGTPDAIEIRKKISVMVREKAYEGYAVIVGHGGAASTSNLDGGINVRVEATKEWRIARICRSESISREQALHKLDQEDKLRRVLNKYYQAKNPRHPAFDIILDNSLFSNEQTAEIVVLAMQLKGFVETVE